MECVNINTPEFREALERLKNPLLAEIELSTVNYTLKSVDILLSDRAKQVFDKGEKNKWNLEKILSELSIPKDQKDLLLELGTTNREQLALELASQYGFKVEVNTAKATTKDKYKHAVMQEYTPELDAQGYENSNPTPTSYYANLTVPGGTNYTENEISTPLITPSIKGHAKFSTDNGIGWFRSDDKTVDELKGNWIKNESELPNEFVYSGERYFKKDGEWQTEKRFIEDIETVIWRYNMSLGNERIQNKPESKTRRILEIQSDLFQKGRDKENLVEFSKIGDKLDTLLGDLENEAPYNGWSNDKLEEEKQKVINKYTFKPDRNQNQFLQLLNKDNNWVTFFIKSIIQDSARKGYEYVMFPKGETAAKIEGHETIADEIEKINDQIRELEGSMLDLQGQEELDSLYKRKQELKSQGVEKLRPIEAFYEIRVGNILEKIYGKNNVNTITDEYGNQWREITITEQLKSERILLQKPGETTTSKASPKTIALLKDFIKRIGVNIESLKNITVNGQKTDDQGVARIMQKLIQVVEGKETQALPEEAMHFVVEILKQTNPSLYRKLLGEINGYRMLTEVFSEYGNDKRYQKDGKPDVIKLKEEAIAKVLTETVIKQSEGTTEKPELLVKTQNWWQAIIDFLRNLFNKSGFDRVAMDILSGKFEGTAEDIRAEEGTVFAQKGSQESVYNSLKETASKITLVHRKDNEKESDYFIDGRKIKRRVTNIVKDWYNRMFEEKKLLETDFQKAIYDLKADTGTAGHKALDYAFHLFVDENGYLRDEPLEDNDYESKNPDFDRDKYEILKSNLRDRLNSFERGTRFMSEITIYDPKRDMAGTIDFLAIAPDGKIYMYDWKFMDLNTDKYTDVPWYKVNAWNQQMTQYKIMLEANYGVKAENFKHTRMIPILAMYSKADYKKKIMPKLLSIKIGDVNVKNITEDYLLHVPLEGEKTGVEEIDKLLEKLNSIYKRLSEKKITPAEGQEKNDQLNSLFSAIRQMQVRQNVIPLIRQAKLLNIQIGKTIDMFNTKFEGKDPASFTEEEIDEYTDEVENALEDVRTYTRLDMELESIFSANLSTEEKKTYDDLSSTSNEARRLEIKLEKLQQKFISDFVVTRENIDKFFTPEKVIKGVSKYFVTTSGLQTKAIQWLFKKASKTLTYASFDTQTESAKLAKLKEAYDTWAKSKGLSVKNYFDILKKKNSNELIDEFDPSFYKTLQQKINERDVTWIRDNIDKPAYIEHLKKKLEEEKQRIKDKPRLYNDEEIEALNKGILHPDARREIADAERLYDTSTTESLGWLLYDEIKQFPKRENWESKEWKELTKQENKPAKDFYDYIIERNNEYRQLGYIKNARVFLPYVRKNLAEKFVTGGDMRFGEHFLKSISVDEGDVGFGKIDPLSGRPVNIIPKYFTSELDEEVSTDLFKTMAMYNEAAIRYKYLSKIEAQVRGVLAVERTKKSIATSTFGKTKYKDGQIEYVNENNENSDLYESMMKAIIYDQKFIESETFDQLLFKLGSWGEKLNKKLGTKIFPEDLSERQLSMNKSINQLNNIFQLNTLGLNVLSATSNLFGGNVQSIINAGKYFTKSDYAASQGTLFMNRFDKTNQKKMIGALEYFLPLTENYNREIAKKLSVNTLTQEGIQDFLMTLMRRSDMNVQTSIFYSYLKNTIVMNGQVLNVREYLRTLPEYKNKYEGTREQRLDFDDKFEKEVDRLVEEHGILKVAKIEDGQFVIPGVDRKSDSVIEMRRKIRQLSKDALGNLTEDDLRLINLNVYGKSFMVFKNWIPRLMDVRIGNLKYNSASDAYEWGRMRMVFRVIGEDLLGSINVLHNTLAGVATGNEKGIATLRKLYEKKAEEYKRDTGKDLEMTEEEFIDLVRNGVRGQLLDVLFLTTMFLLVAGLKAIPPDDDEDDTVKNQYRFMVRMLDKFRTELSYFYNPTNFTALVSQGVFPSLSLLDNVKKGVTNFLKENWALATGDEDSADKVHVIKYWMKTFPFTNQMIGYLPMFYPELAKDLGIRIQSDYSLIRK